MMNLTAMMASVSSPQHISSAAETLRGRKDAVNLVRQNTKSNIFTQVNTVQTSILQLPSAAIRWDISKAVDRSNEPSPGDAKGGFHEEGGIWGVGYDNQEKVVNSKPGPYSNPSIDKEASVDVWDAQDPSQALQSVEGTFHIHPSGEITSGNSGLSPTSSGTTLGSTTTTSNFKQPPSDVDVQSAKTEAQGGTVTGNSIVIGARDKTVYFYNGSGVVGTFPLNLFKTLGNDDKPQTQEQQPPPHK